MALLGIRDGKIRIAGEPDPVTKERTVSEVSIRTQNRVADLGNGYYAYRIAERTVVGKNRDHVIRMAEEPELELPE